MLEMLGWSLLITLLSAVQGVRVCEWGKYGHNCDRLCSDHCGPHPARHLRPCDKYTGECLQGCVRGRHGDHCDQLCSPNCIKATCNQGNGGCTLGCMDGYSGYFCIRTAGDGHMQFMWMVHFAIVIFSTVLCWKSRRCRRMFDIGFTQLIRRNPRSSSSDPSQDLSRSRREPQISTASHATPSQAERDLFRASRAGDLEEVKRLLFKGDVNVNCKVVTWTPVMLAAYSGHREVVVLLVIKGADVSLVDVDRNNILHLASWGGDMETVKFILSLNVVDINAMNGYEQTAAGWARHWGHQHVVRLLESRGGRPGQTVETSTRGETAGVTRRSAGPDTGDINTW
ncbi:uncharacterized protein [Haliotis cracherodii]|uniref:uncharacterized protein n=1 Tax=Haliotis cracherodii TaxID=6455 RepID=UPI0039E85C05